MKIIFGNEYLRIFNRNCLAVALALTIGIQATANAAPIQIGSAIRWTTTHTHAFNATDATFNGYAADQEPVPITVALKLQNQDVMNSFIRELFRPGSPSYHQFLTSQESTATFAPTQQQAQAVADYLIQQGFTDVQVAPNRLLVTANGTVSKASSTFNTKIGHFTRQGQSGIANLSDIQVPEVLTQVDRVLGLETLERPRTYSRSGVLPAYTVQPTAGNPAAHAYYPQEFATVYNAGSTPAATDTTVAIIGWGSMTNAVTDLNKFESDQKIAAVPTQIVTVGGASNDDSGQGEWGMDAQAIVGISGGVQRLIFYASGGATDNTVSGLLQAINRAVSDNSAKVINMSWGSAECKSSPGFADSAFQLGVAQGQTFSASSGDNGSYPCPINGRNPANGSYGSTTTRSVIYPASSPYVVAVGGTTLNTSTSDGYTSETTWPYSGGGISGSEPTPAWQPSSYPHRELPDLAFDADWTNSPIIAYFTASPSAGINSSGYYTNGGTSLASPLFVGAWARLETANNNRLGFAAPGIYSRASSLAFHDISTGNNGYYPAGAGWDNATGWGSFDIEKANIYISRYWHRPNIVPIITELLLQ